MNEIHTERAGNILTVVLNRPTRKNAMTSAMYIALADVLNDAAKDDTVRVVIWHGAGDSFSAGNDLEDFMKNPPGAGESPQSKLMKAFVDFDKPLIAAVHGAAVGGGTTMLVHCDFVYAAPGTRFQLPFVNLALVPEFGSSSALPARIGYLAAAELYMLGAPFDAKRAAELGIVTQVVAEEDLLAKATETATKLAVKPPAALRATKRLLKEPFRASIVEAIADENKAFAVQVRSAEAKEAFNAFLEKRAPDFGRVHQAAAAE
jgi:enoyl-CoA hydratase/carnithine racemase